MSARDELSLRNYGKFGDLETYFKLRDIGKAFKDKDFRYISPATAALLQREEWGSPREQGAFNLSQDYLRDVYPLLNVRERQSLAGTYLIPERYRGYVSEDYLKGHETQHAISKLLRSGKHAKSLARGSLGYLPLPRSEFESYSGIENWLLNYPKEQRAEERAAHIRGLSWMGKFPPAYYKKGEK